MENAEIVVNLWYVVDKDSRLVYRLMGRAYALAGTDQQKTALLKTLARTDYLTAQQFSVPKRFIVSSNTQTMEGFCHTRTLHENSANVFEEVFARLEKELPPLIRFVAGEGQATPATLPPNPLCVTTALIEDDNGILTPRV